MNILLGQAFALYSDSVFFTLLPMYLFELGYSKVGLSHQCIIKSIATKAFFL